MPHRLVFLPRAVKRRRGVIRRAAHCTEFFAGVFELRREVVGAAFGVTGGGIIALCREVERVSAAFELRGARFELGGTGVEVGGAGAEHVVFGTQGGLSFGDLRLPRGQFRRAIVEAGAFRFQRAARGVERFAFIAQRRFARFDGRLPFLESAQRGLVALTERFGFLFVRGAFEGEGAPLFGEVLALRVEPGRFVGKRLLALIARLLQGPDVVHLRLHRVQNLFERNALGQVRFHASQGSI